MEKYNPKWLIDIDETGEEYQEYLRGCIDYPIRFSEFVRNRELAHVVKMIEEMQKEKYWRIVSAGEVLSAIKGETDENNTNRN